MMEVELKNINHRRAELKVLEGLNLSVRAGEFVVISGASGSGKSLLFSIMCGIVKPDSGSVTINSLAISEMDDVENSRFRCAFGVVFQRAALISNLSLAENFMLPLNRHFQHWNQQQKQQQVEEISARLGLSRYLNHRPDSLSNGLARLAGFARALMTDPKCIVWDSPFLDMDNASEQLIIEILQEYKDKGASVILFTNRQLLADMLADTHLQLTDGQLRQNNATGQ